MLEAQKILDRLEDTRYLSMSQLSPAIAQCIHRRLREVR
jgi:hypothetical protein